MIEQITGEPIAGQPIIGQQKHRRSFHEVVILSAAHAQVRALKRATPQAALHGNKVWSSSYVLMDFLHHNPLAPGLRVLDLGCGWGVLSCFVARAFGASVTGVDADPGVEPFFALHALHNGVQPQFLCQRFEQLDAGMLAQFDVIIGADICFWDDAAAPLASMLERAIEAGVKHVFIADPGRPPFWQLADHCSEAFFAEVSMHRIEQPRPTAKPVLVIHNA